MKRLAIIAALLVLSTPALAAKWLDSPRLTPKELRIQLKEATRACAAGNNEACGIAAEIDETLGRFYRQRHPEAR